VYRGVCALTLADDRPNVVQTLIPWLLDESESLKGIPFPKSSPPLLETRAAVDRS
jgi:hypothetical protein